MDRKILRPRGRCNRCHARDHAGNLQRFANGLALRPHERVANSIFRMSGSREMTEGWKLVDQTGASWNRIAGLLKALHAFQKAA